MDSLRDFHHVYPADGGAEVADFVGEGNHGRQQGVGGVLDHLGGFTVGFELVNPLEHVVHFPQDGQAAIVNAAQHDAIGVHEVGNRLPFLEEFGVHADAKVSPGLFARGLFQNGEHDFVGGAWHNSALDHHHVVIGFILQHFANLAGYGLNKSQVNFIAPKGSAHGN